LRGCPNYLKKSLLCQGLKSLKPLLCKVRGSLLSIESFKPLSAHGCSLNFWLVLKNTYPSAPSAKKST
jgi:hypothetical protein